MQSRKIGPRKDFEGSLRLQQAFSEHYKKLLTSRSHSPSIGSFPTTRVLVLAATVHVQNGIGVAKSGSAKQDDSVKNQFEHLLSLLQSHSSMAGVSESQRASEVLLSCCGILAGGGQRRAGGGRGVLAGLALLLECRKSEDLTQQDYGDYGSKLALPAL